jgi:hypothetical protein
LLVKLVSTTSKGIIMKTLKTLTKLLIAIPVMLAGCDHHDVDLDYRGNGDCGSAREYTPWRARDMEVSGFGCKKCDNWNYRIDRDVYPEGEPDYGCASASNLASMVANKNDLVEGRDLASGDAARHDIFTEYYRQDKIKALLKGEKIIAQ